MNKKIYIAGAIALGCLILGASVEHIRMKVSVKKAAPDEPEIIHHVQKVARESQPSAGQEKMIADLQNKVASLNAELEKLRAEKIRTEEAAEDDDPHKHDRRGRGDFRERLERMKKEEPERYAEIQKRREEFKTRMEERKQNKRDFLASVSRDDMSVDQEAAHERLIYLNERVDEIMDLMYSGTAENRDELRREMFESFHELRELNDLERIYLLEQTANAVGYDGDEAALFTEHIETIIKNTSMMAPVRHGGPAPGGGRRR
ncbi:MAG: hypothetical protein R6V06_07135 [Kiritimatiellia bacterium]